VASYSCLVAERGDHGGEHGQESEEGKEGKEGKENSQEEKEVTRSMKISCAGQRLRSVTPSQYGWQQLSLTEYPRNKRSGRTVMRWLLHNGPGFSLNEQTFAKNIGTDSI
jgi:hypothetical protein